jgi:hypothetical protein
MMTHDNDNDDDDDDDDDRTYQVKNDTCNDAGLHNLNHTFNYK